MEDPYDLRRFVDAQAGDYAVACRELREGRKRSHWIWYVFPQLRGLGRSGNAEFYGLSSLAEARAYLAHPVLGPRLRECAALLLAVPAGRGIESVVGAVDALKVRSSMTLFDAAATAGLDAGEVFRAVLDRFYDGEPDERTLELLRRA